MLSEEQVRSCVVPVVVIGSAAEKGRETIVQVTRPVPLMVGCAVKLLMAFPELDGMSSEKAESASEAVGKQMPFHE